MGVSEDAKSFAASLTMPFAAPTWASSRRLAGRSRCGQSLALLTLHDGDSINPANAFGMLVLGSPDPLRFEATMGTEFLSRISALASAALSRMRPVPLTLARG